VGGDPATVPPAAPAPGGGRWVGDSQTMAQVAIHPRGSLVVEGKHTDVFHLPDGRRMTGQELLRRADWPWRDCLQLPRLREVRLTATSPT